MSNISPTPLPYEPQVQISQTPSGSSLMYFALRLPLAFILSGIVVVVSGVLWGGLAYLTNSVYFIVAILIGLAVTFAVTFPFKRVPFLLAILLFLPALVLTVIAVLWGDYVFYTLSLMKDTGMDLIDALERVARFFIRYAITEEGDSIGSIILAMIGTVLGFVSALRK